MLVSEQYRDQEQPTWFSDSLGTAAKWICSQDGSRIVGHGGANGFVWIKRGLVTYFSCYLTPNEPINDFRDKIDALEDTVLDTPGDVVVGGDFRLG